MKKTNTIDAIMRLIRTSSLVVCFLYLRSRYDIQIDGYIIVTITVCVWGLTEFLQSQNTVEPQKSEITINDKKDERVSAAKLAIALCSDDDLLWDTLLKHRGAVSQKGEAAPDL